MKEPCKKATEMLLLRAGKAVSSREIADRLGVSKTAVAVAISTLRREYGPRLQTKTHRGKATYHEIIDAKLPQQTGLLADLWRGWVNPSTGIVPERLGL